jgi:uncharacterized membrane protein
MVSFYFSKVCKETSSLVGKNVEWTGSLVGKNREWTGWTLNFVFAIIVVLGIVFSMWIISGRDEKRKEVRGVEKVQKAG